MYAIRPLQPHDYRPLTELLKSLHTQGGLSDGFTHILGSYSELQPQGRWVVEQGRDVLAYAGYIFPVEGIALAIVSIVVVPSRRGEGIGNYLYGRLIEMVRQFGAERVISDVFDHDAAGIAFAARRQFVEIGRTIAYQLDTTNSAVTAPTLDAGLTIRSLDQFPQRGLSSRLLPIWNRTRPLQPQHWPYTPLHERQLERELFDTGATVALPHSFVVVSQSLQIVALNLNIALSDNHLFTFYTAVDPDFTGRGLATALKQQLIAAARKAGVRWLSAENSTHNPTMCHINERLGFRPMATLITYQRTL